MVVAVTGASGQLGQALQHIAASHPDITFCFASSAEADITDKKSVNRFFTKHKPDACINAAAYTAVDKAESEPEKAFAVNVTGAANVAEICKRHDVLLVHISTDFVFDGTKTEPYTEEDIPNPQSVYGKTKLQGEQEIQAILERYYIIRTSWVYSQFGHNFMKTMLRLAGERDRINVVNDQIGTPTHAVDLAEAIITILKSNKNHYGIYNFSNEGSCSWYDFAKKIFEVNKITIDLQPIPTSAYPTPAKRPKYSVLDKSNISSRFNLMIKDWDKGLATKDE
ncbi:dTDP-4-dehydrorhamnose reductase [Flavobacterium cyanobacteriorum]|uniref:dTDP-4-dehydrorhamnose reductase n=1 Tax=Flavobacterium cyanobacteriorum TaxID=2022802 RepID=A0A255YVW1_9FLAO|nr:dTDP-4-dehydrorhamnose reductase [Flavobacterium cyanobacteriorum]OYQ33319.1 dTDP-4-dehydrorhamnose reductase [Flavobacterium cyanobacteriorum]